MNVLTVLCSGGWMPGNLSEGWRRLGCGVQEFFYGRTMGRSWTAPGRADNRATNARLLETARRLKSEGALDLVFAVVYDDVLEVETARALRDLGVPLVNYHVDMVGQWHRVLRTARYFDRIACAQREHWHGLERAGARPFYMPMAANAADDSQDRIDFDGLVYMGSPWLYRRATLRRVQDAGVPLRVYGHNWIAPAAGASSPPPYEVNRQPLRKNLHDVLHYLLPRLREEGLAGLAESARLRFENPEAAAAALGPEVVMGAYPQGEFGALVRGAAANLGFTHFKGVPGTAGEQRQLRLRDFEIPMAGGFYLAQDCAQLRELFAPGENVAAWSDADDLIEKARHYLMRPAERQRIAASAQAHCLAHHTWAHRFADLLAELGMTPP